MLDFMFNAEKKTVNVVKVVLVTDINKLNEERLVKNIGNKAYEECSKLKHVYFSGKSEPQFNNEGGLETTVTEYNVIVPFGYSSLSFLNRVL